MKNLGALSLPTRSGWMVEWYNKEVHTTKNGKVIRHISSFESTSLESVEAKAEQMKKDGYEVIGISECIF